MKSMANEMFIEVNEHKAELTPPVKKTSIMQTIEDRKREQREGLFSEEILAMSPKSSNVFHARSSKMATSENTTSAQKKPIDDMKKGPLGIYFEGAYIDTPN